MSKFISQKRLDKKLIENVLGISVEAKAAKKKDHEVINATSGTYYDDNGTMHVFKCVDNHFKKCDYNHDLTYSSMVGPIEMDQVVPEHILGDDYLKEYSDYNFATISTIGGTGAITTAFACYADEDSFVLLPEIRWPAYYQIADNHNLKSMDYVLFNKEGTFNFDSLKEKIEYLSKIQNKILIVINDPCENPTGYSLSNKEYKKLVELINQEAKKVAITLLFDIAYLDYGKDNGNDARNNFKELKNLTADSQVLFAFSASKTFGIYGLRLGALVNMTKDEEELAAFMNVGKFFCRSTWSNPNHFAVNVVCDTLLSPSDKASFLDELKMVSNHLIERGTTMTKILESYHVPYTPYKGGFFIFINCNNPKFLSECKKNKLYAIEMNHGLRIAVSSISNAEAVLAGHIIGKAYQNSL